MAGIKERGYTERQTEIILKMGRLGYSNQAIADRLGRSRQAIEKYRRKLRDKERGGQAKRGASAQESVISSL